MSKIFDVIEMLEKNNVHFFLERTRNDSIRLSATLVGKRMEIDIFKDNHVEVSSFIGNEGVEGGEEIIKNMVKHDKV